MKIADEVLEELRQGRSLKEIRTKFRSSSQIYEGLRIFLEQSEKLLEETNAATLKTAEQLSEKQAKLEKTKAGKQEINGEVEALRLEREKSLSEVTQMRNERDCLKNEMEAMQSQGYTADILGKISSIEPRSGAEFWFDLRTVSRCREVAKEAAVLRQEKAGLKADIKCLKATKKQTEGLVLSLENKLDDLKLQVETFREAASTIEMFLADGYSVQDLKSLKAGLDMVGIKREMRASVGRLIEGMKAQRSLMNLEQKVNMKRMELAELSEACAQSRKDAEVIQAVTVTAIEEAGEASVKAIAMVAEHVKTAAEASTSTLEKLRDETSAQIKEQVRQTIGDLKTELGKWGELQQEKARLEQLLAPARLLFGIIECPDYLNSIPTLMVVQLYERLQGWCAANLKDFLIQPSASISARAYNLSSFQFFDLAVLTELVCEGLRLYMKKKQGQSTPMHEPEGSR